MPWLLPPLPGSQTAHSIVLHVFLKLMLSLGFLPRNSPFLVPQDLHSSLFTMGILSVLLLALCSSAIVCHGHTRLPHTKQWYWENPLTIWTSACQSLETYPNINFPSVSIFPYFVHRKLLSSRYGQGSLWRWKYFRIHGWFRLTLSHCRPLHSEEAVMW